jgi:transposase-like protein
MRLHANARLTPICRREMVELVVEDGWQIKDAAREAGVSARTYSNWVRRYRADGLIALVDRSFRGGNGWTRRGERRPGQLGATLPEPLLLINADKPGGEMRRTMSTKPEVGPGR